MPHKTVDFGHDSFYRGRYGSNFKKIMQKTTQKQQKLRCLPYLVEIQKNPIGSSLGNVFPQINPKK